MERTSDTVPVSAGAAVPAPVEIIRDPEKAVVALKPPRPAMLAALRQPDSASGLARRLELPRQRINHPRDGRPHRQRPHAPGPHTGGG